MKTGVNHFQISLQSASASADQVALCAAIGLVGEGAEVPEWVHLLPAGEIRTGDGRGPYRVRNAQALIEKSLQANSNARLVLDENHSTDLAAPKGLPAPAMGWIIALESRADGVWGKVEWTDDGRQLVAARKYRGISPVILHDKAGTIDALLRASLVNKPNFVGLSTLHFEETDMTLLAKITAALKLPSDTNEAALIAAITTLHAQHGTHQTALQAQVDPVAEAAGLTKGAKVHDVVAAIKQLVSGNGDAATIVALQAEVKALGTDLLTLRQDGSREGEVQWFDEAQFGAPATSHRR